MLAIHLFSVLANLSFCLMPFMMKPLCVSMEEMTVSWDPTLHMAIHERMREATEDGANLRGW